MDADPTRYNYEMVEQADGDYIDFGEAEGIIDELENKVSRLEEEAEAYSDRVRELEDIIDLHATEI